MRYSLQDAIADAGITLPPSEPEQPDCNREPPPCSNGPDDDDDFDATGFFTRQKAIPIEPPLEAFTPEPQLPLSTQEQLHAFRALRRACGVQEEPLRPPSFDPELTTRVAARIPPEHDTSDILDAAPEHAPASFTTMDFLRLEFEPKDRILLFHESSQAVWHLRHGDDDLGPLKIADELLFQVNPITGGNLHDIRTHTASYCHLLLRFTTLPIDEALRIILQLPVWIKAVYRGMNGSIEALAKIDAKSPAQFADYVRYIGGHLAALGADPTAFQPTALSRLPRAEGGGILGDLLYLDTRLVDVKARPIITMPEPTPPSDSPSEPLLQRRQSSPSTANNYPTTK